MSFDNRNLPPCFCDTRGPLHCPRCRPAPRVSDPDPVGREQLHLPDVSIRGPIVQWLRDAGHDVDGSTLRIYGYGGRLQALTEFQGHIALNGTAAALRPTPATRSDGLQFITDEATGVDEPIFDAIDRMTGLAAAGVSNAAIPQGPTV